eukprot:scaffold22589_cov138-Cylindrotheca_fusiformis.AAC.65
MITHKLDSRFSFASDNGEEKVEVDPVHRAVGREACVVSAVWLGGGDVKNSYVEEVGVVVNYTARPLFGIAEVCAAGIRIVDSLA